MRDKFHFNFWGESKKRIESRLKAEMRKRQRKADRKDDKGCGMQTKQFKSFCKLQKNPLFGWK